MKIIIKIIHCLNKKNKIKTIDAVFINPQNNASHSILVDKKGP